MTCTLTYRLGGINKSAVLSGISEPNEVNIQTGSQPPQNTGVCWEVSGVIQYSGFTSPGYLYGCSSSAPVSYTSPIYGSGYVSYSIGTVSFWYVAFLPNTVNVRILPPNEPLNPNNQSGDCNACKNIVAECFIKVFKIADGSLIYEDSGSCPIENINIECSNCPPSNLDCGDCCLDCNSIFNQISGIRALLRGIN